MYVCMYTSSEQQTPRQGYMYKDFTGGKHIRENGKGLGEAWGLVRFHWRFEGRGKEKVGQKHLGLLRKVW